VSAKRKGHSRLGSVAGVVGIVVVLGIAALLVMYLISGRGFGLWRFARLGRAVLDSRSISGYSHGDFTNIVFLHHSVGHNLIEQGDVRRRFAENGYSFWDHGFNWGRGLVGPDGNPRGYHYYIPEDNTYVDGLANLFAQKAYGLPLNAFSGLLQHEVIAFKSCFPVSDITSDEQLDRYKSYYLGMRDVMDQHEDRVFIVVTPPPLNPAATDAETAARARAFADWLTSGEYLSGHPNVFTFDFFGLLAEDDPASPDYNMLRAEYRDGEDSHPNQMANEAIGPLFVDFIVDGVEEYRAVYESESTD
jgi:hypothetical protein